MPSGSDEERLIDVCSTHWIKYVLPLFFYLLITGASLLLFYLADTSAYRIMWLSHFTFLVGLLLILISHHWFFHRVMSEGMMDILITSRRIIYFRDSLFFREDMHELLLNRIRAVEAQESGRLLARVPHPHRKAKLILQLLKLK
jgi:hypothetical protein